MMSAKPTNTLLELAEHLPAEAAAALLNLATGAVPLRRRPHPTTSMMSIGKETKTGPAGEVLESWKARRIRTGIWAAWVVSLAHFTIGVAIATRSPKRSGSERVARILLSGGHDQRRSGHAGIPQATEAVAKPAAV